jgi:uncharacterized membrane protein
MNTLFIIIINNLQTCIVKSKRVDPMLYKCALEFIIFLLIQYFMECNFNLILME